MFGVLTILAFAITMQSPIATGPLEAFPQQPNTEASPTWELINGCASMTLINSLAMTLGKLLMPGYLMASQLNFL